MVWKRSEKDYPLIWSSFICERTKHRFIIKDLTPEYYDIVLGYMTNLFMKESAICKPLNIFEDQASRKQMQSRWLEVMRRNLAIICVTDDDELPRVAGVHLTAIREKGENKQGTKDDQYSNFYKVVNDLKSEGQLFEKFSTDHYLGSLGLFVVPEFRGMGIATEILKARITMCQKFGLRGTATVFSTDGAQAAARKAGYTTYSTRVFEGQELAIMGIAID